MGKFWMSDDFVRIHARKLSPSAIAVFMVLACHCNKDHKTTIGIRRMADTLCLSKTTVVKALKELKVYQLLVQRTHGVYQIRMPGVPFYDIEVYQRLEHKEVFKEGIKEKEILTSRGNISPALDRLRERWGSQRDVL
jgi:DNA-binding transcriptional MocR family regulator